MKQFLTIAAVLALLSVLLFSSAVKLAHQDNQQAQRRGEITKTFSYISMCVAIVVVIGGLAVLGSRNQVDSAHVRHIAGHTQWFIPTAEMRVGRQFDWGLMRNVTFNPRAAIIDHVFCGVGKSSEAEAVGDLTIYEESTTMPSDARRKCRLAYDNVAKEFHDKNNRKHTFTSADYLLLCPDGDAWAGWKNPPRHSQVLK